MERDTNQSLPQLALERDGSNTLLRRYIYGANRISMTSGGNTYYYHYDPLGSVANLTSSSGSSEWTDSYEPFGAIHTETKDDPSAPMNPLKFARELVDSTGLYYLRARQYDPSTGRFGGVDPAPSAPIAGLTSLYAYVGDRPTTQVDPTGRTFVSAADGVENAVAATSSCGALSLSGGASATHVASTSDRTLASVSRLLSCGILGIQIAGKQMTPDDPFLHAWVTVRGLLHTQRALESYRILVTVAVGGFEETTLVKGVTDPLSGTLNAIPAHFEIPAFELNTADFVYVRAQVVGVLAGGVRRCFQELATVKSPELQPWMP